MNINVQYKTLHVMLLCGFISCSYNYIYIFNKLNLY